MENVASIDEKVLSNAFKIDEKEIKNHLASMVKESVEETLNALLNAEADAICGAGRYQHSPERQDTRAGSYPRKLMTGAGELELQVPRLRSLPFETQIIERYKRRESSVEEALVEMYLAGVSVRRRVFIVFIPAGVHNCNDFNAIAYEAFIFATKWHRFCHCISNHI